MSLRIRFVEPRPPGHNVYDRVLLPRLGLPLMATMLAERGHDTAVYCEMLAPVDIGECLDADLVGISGTTATQPAGYALADELTRASVPVVLGGPHVSFCVEEALEHAPYVVRGEGQQTILELAEALERETPLEGIAGLSWRDDNGRVRHNPKRANCSLEQFQSLPMPDLSLIAGYARMRVKPAMTQWGCPFDCEFCSVTAQFSRRVRHRRTDQVLAELRALDAAEVFFHDDNFVVDKRRAGSLLSGMIDSGLTPSFSAQVRADSVLRSRRSGEIDDDFLSLLRRAGCQMVMVGFESVSEESLARVGKRSDVSLSEKAVRAFHKHGIGVHGMFVLGLDGDRASCGRETVRFARKLGIDTLQLMMVTPIPGTRLYDRIRSEERLIETDWSLFDGHHAVLMPERMTPLELQLSTFDALRRFYSRAAIVRPAIRGALRHLPGLAGIALRHVSELAGAVRREGRERLGAADDSVGSRLGRALSAVAPSLGREERARLQAALWVSALRLYGRRQVAIALGQDRTLAHMAQLAELTGP